MQTRHGRFSLLAVVGVVTLVLCLLSLPAVAQQPPDDGREASLMHVPNHGAGAEKDDQQTHRSVAAPAAAAPAPAAAAAAAKEEEGDGSPPPRRLNNFRVGDGIFTLLMSSNANNLRISMPKDGLM